MREGPLVGAGKVRMVADERPGRACYLDGGSKEVRPIVVLSSVIIDEITLPDGRRRADVLGGAGTHSAIGASAWWPSVAIVAGVGRDLNGLTRRQMTGLGIRTEGLLIRDEQTIRNRLVYRNDGERTETPVLGVEHFQKMQTGPDDVPHALLPAVGTYFFCDLRGDFWAAFHRRRRLLGTTLWELHGGAANASATPLVTQRLSAVDIFSLNLVEARALLGIEEPHAIVSRLLTFGAGIVVLRMGAFGALIGTSRHRLRTYPPACHVVDVTGAGNAFCGAFLAAWCKSGDLQWTARAATAAATQCVARYGPPQRIDHQALDALATATKVEDAGAPT